MAEDFNLLLGYTDSFCPLNQPSFSFMAILIIEKGGGYAIIVNFNKFISFVERQGLKAGFSKGVRISKNKYILMCIAYIKNLIFGKKNLNDKIEYMNCHDQIIKVPVDLIKKGVSTSYSKVRFDFDLRYIHSNDKERISGVILGGNWDKLGTYVNEKGTYISFKERFIDNKKWEETYYFDLFKTQKNSRNTSGRYSRCESWNEFKNKYLRSWDCLYNDIKKNGYKKQEKLEKGENTNEIEVCISRNGKILLRNGTHRLSIAKILNLNEIPVIVNVWHKEYIDWVKENTDIDKITPKTAIQPILDGRAEAK